MQKMTADERKKYVADQSAKRTDLQIKVDALAKQRADYVKAEISKLPDQASRDSFDAKVDDLIRTQALKKGIKY
jgi:hypothetical protein